MRNLAIVILALLASACSTTVPKPEPDPAFAPVRPVSIQPPPANTGAIFRAGYGMSMYENITARQVGDILTVTLDESTNASKSASTSTSKGSAIEVPAPTIFGSPVLHNGVNILNNSLAMDREFAGAGDSTQSNSLSGSITVTVAEVLANGNLVVRGEKMLSLNQGNEYIRFSGIVRPADINSNNLVSSTRVANARIIYGGDGALAEANTKGWFDRFLNSPWWPF